MGPRILVTGSTGQVGSELVPALRKKYGPESVVAGIMPDLPSPDLGKGPEVRLDVTDGPGVAKALKENKVEVVYHLAAVLSAAGESDPGLAWNVNLQGLKNVLDGALEAGASRLFWPSSVAVFGPDSPKKAPQAGPLNPISIYGVTKVAGELLCSYYFTKYGLDTRCVRYPGLISSKTRPGGGTTDYAVEMFYAAIRGESYACFLRADTTLPMMYMPDALGAAMKLMEAEQNDVKTHEGYNVAAMSFSPRQLAEQIHRLSPGFRCSYSPDSRQRIADSWPSSLDDSQARKDWGWSPAFKLRRMTDDMMRSLGRDDDDASRPRAKPIRVGSARFAAW